MKTQNKKEDEPPQYLLVILLIVFLMIIAACISAKSEEEHKVIYNYSDLFVGEITPIITPVETRNGIVTAYNPVESQCDSTPDITASGKKVREGYIANNCLRFGTIVEIDGKMYEVQDRMNEKKSCDHYDILMFSLEEAKEWGKRTKTITIYQ